MLKADQIPACDALRFKYLIRNENRNNATVLRINTTPIETAISSSFASITGAVAAIALPPQIPVPNIISCEDLFFNLNKFASKNPAKTIIDKLMAVCNKPLLPIEITLEMFKPKPNRITARFNVFFLILFVFLGTEIKDKLIKKIPNINEIPEAKLFVTEKSGSNKAIIQPV